jgi:hypothetical protein
MFCPKCGTQNPDDGRFCRSCGADLENVSAALTGKTPKAQYVVDPRKRGVSWEHAITKIFTGMAFLIVAVILGVTGKFGGQNWWFWLLIPGRRIFRPRRPLTRSRRPGPITSRRRRNRSTTRAIWSNAPAASPNRRRGISKWIPKAKP